MRGFLQILELCYFTNHTTQRTLETKQAILDLAPAPQNKFGFVQFEPILESTLNKPNSSSINTDYMVGLVDGDGSFNFGFKSTLKKPSVFLDELYLISQLYKELKIDLY